MAFWLLPFISIIICCTLILVVTYTYLFFLEKKAFIGIWAISWSIYLIAQVLTLFAFHGKQGEIALGINFSFYLMSALFLIIGAYSSQGKKTPKVVLGIVLISTVWLFYAVAAEKQFFYITFPIAIVIGGLTTWTGILFLHYEKKKRYLQRILGIFLILWGVHKMGYSFMVEDEILAVWEYVVSAVFSLLITISFIFIYFEKRRDDFLEVQSVLIESERRLVNIIQNQKDIIFEADGEGTLLFVSPASTEILGISSYKMQGHSLQDFMGKIDWEKICSSKEGVYFEKIFVKEDGSNVYLHIYCKPNFNSEGLVEGIFGSAHNITQDKLLDEAMEYNKLKTEFFANISHELRTPLNVMLASTQLLELYNQNDSSANLPEKVDRTVVIFKQNIFRLLRLINNLIDITKVDTGFFELSLHNYNIVDIVEEITMSVVEYVESKGISIQFDTDVEEKIIACDEDKIERVMLNLLSNAVKFTKPGGNIFVTIADGKEYVTISVKDTGIGIPENKQKIIFDRFRQVDESLSRKNEGSGIGLSLVKSLVELHKGTIEIQSEYGVGSEFIIKIPADKVEGEEARERFESLGSKKIDIEFSDIY